MNVTPIRPTAANAAPTRIAAGTASTAHHDCDQSHRQHDDDEAAGVHAAAHERVDELAERDVADPERRGEDRVVGLEPLELREDVDRRLVDRPVHRRGREHRRRDELLVRNELALVGDVADELARRRCRSRAGRRRARRSPTRSGASTTADDDVAVDESSGERSPERDAARWRRSGRRRSPVQPPRDEADGQHRADGDERREVRDVPDRGQRVERPGAEIATERDAVPERCRPGDRLRASPGAG